MPVIHASWRGPFGVVEVVEWDGGRRAGRVAVEVRLRDRMRQMGSAFSHAPTVAALVEALRQAGEVLSVERPKARARRAVVVAMSRRRRECFVAQKPARISKPRLARGADNEC